MRSIIEAMATATFLTRYCILRGKSRRKAPSFFFLSLSEEQATESHRRNVSWFSKERFALNLQRIKIVPQILSTSLLNHVIHYILPSDTGKTRCDVTFPQYEWLVCVVAFSAVHTSAAKDLTKVNSQVVGDIIETLITAILDTN